MTTKTLIQNNSSELDSPTQFVSLWLCSTSSQCPPLTSILLSYLLSLTVFSHNPYVQIPLSLGTNTRQR